MKIAFIVSQFPALSETFILNQITGLIDRGHEVDIFADSKREEPITHSDIEKYDLLSRTYYRQMSANKVWRVVKAFGLIISNFYKNPIVIIKSLNPFKYGRKALSLELLYATIPFLGKGPYDIIYCHFGPNGIIGVLLKELGMKGKIVTTFHGYDMSVFVASRGESVYSDLFARGDLFMPISNHWKKRLVALGCGENKIIVHRAGISLAKFRFRERQFPKSGTTNILTVGRLVEKKGVEYAIRAVASVISKHANLDMKYRIAGDGPLRKKLRALISELGAKRQIELLGSVKADEVKQLMMDSDIFLLPSVTSQEGDQEGIPVVLMEAMATGMPVISTYHSGIPELIKDGRSGFLVPERDVDALAEKLEYFIEHPEIWPEMGRAGRRFVEEHYNIEKLNDQLVEIYHKLLDGKLP